MNTNLFLRADHRRSGSVYHQFHIPHLCRFCHYRHGDDDFFWVTATTSEMDTSIAYAKSLSFSVPSYVVVDPKEWVPEQAGYFL